MNLSTKDLPTGTVTFLFSDIEGSTRILQELGDAYAATLEAHAAIRAEVSACAGTEVSTEGDAFFCERDAPWRWTQRVIWCAARPCPPTGPRPYP
jgi:class 3 adenylate cyclase